MVDRLVPYKSYSYERDLLEYVGSFIYDPTNVVLPMAVYVSPGLTVTRLVAGSYQIDIIDQLPIFVSIANSSPNPPDLTCIDKGYGSSCMIWVGARPELQAATTPIKIGSSQASIVTNNAVKFFVKTYVSNVLTDISWSFKIWVTGQPAKYVQGLGA